LILVLTGGELPAMTVINGVVRLLPGTPRCPCFPWNEESHTSLLLEHSALHAAQPAFRGLGRGPRCCAAGDHGAVAVGAPSSSSNRTPSAQADLYPAGSPESNA